MKRKEKKRNHDGKKSDCEKCEDECREQIKKFQVCQNEKKLKQQARTVKWNERSKKEGAKKQRREIKDQI